MTLLLAAVAGPAPLRAHSIDAALFPVMIEALTAELAKSPETDLFIQRGELYVHQKEWAKAEADFAAAAALDPQRLIIGILRARALLAGGQPAQARPLVDHYLEQKPSQAEAWFLRGQIMAALGEHERARSDYAEGFRRAPDANAEQLLQWTRLLAQLPGVDPREVVAVLDEAVARLGPAPALIDSANALEFARGAPEAALARIERAVETGGWRGSLEVQRGDVLEKIGQRPAAAAAYRAALDAIEQLPERQRGAAEVQQLARVARAALDRLVRN